MIENTTVYSSNVLKTFIKESLKKSRLICFISLAVVIAFGTLNVILEPSDWLFSVSMFAIAFISTLVVLIVPVFYLKKTKKMPTIKNTYEFYPNKLVITTFSNDIQVTKAEWQYNIVKKIIEKEKLILLFLNNSQALIVDTEAFSEPNDKEIVKKYIASANVSRETN